MSAVHVNSNARYALRLHPLAVRVMDWINAAAMIMMIMSGWKIYNDYIIFSWLPLPDATTLGTRRRPYSPCRSSTPVFLSDHRGVIYLTCVCAYLYFGYWLPTLWEALPIYILCILIFAAEFSAPMEGGGRSYRCRHHLR